MSAYGYCTSERGTRPAQRAGKGPRCSALLVCRQNKKWRREAAAHTNEQVDVLLWVANATAHWCYVIIMTNIYKVCCFLRVKQDSIMARLCEPPPSLRQGGCFVNPLISFAHSSPRVQTRRPTTKVQVQLFSARVFHSCVSRQLLLASRVLRLGEEEEEEEDV